MVNIFSEVNKSDPQRIARLRGELRAWRTCKGASCHDGGSPPSPVPSGLELYRKAGQCLRCSGDCSQKNERLMMAPCQDIKAAWKSSVDSRNFSQIAAASNASLCLNVDSRKCEAGTHVWLYACQGSSSQVHTANHFKFDPKSGTIRSVFCDDEKSRNLCLSTDTASDGGLVLADCASASATGFVQEIKRAPVQYRKGNQCLRCAGSCTEGNERIILGSCEGIASSWKASVDSLEFPQIAAASNAGLCLNVDSRTCKAGTHVWLYECQGSHSQVHAANHFKFHAQNGTIRSTYCADEQGGDWCLSADTASDGGLVLAKCTSSSAKGFVEAR